MSSILRQPQDTGPFEYYIPDFDEAEAYNLPWDEDGRTPLVRDADRVGVIRAALARHDWALAVLALSKVQDPDLRGALMPHLQEPAAPGLDPRVQSDLWRLALTLGKGAQGARRMKCLQYDALDVANMFRIGVCMILLTQEGATRLQFQYTRARFRAEPARDARSLPRGTVPGVYLSTSSDNRLRLNESAVPLRGGWGGLIKQADGSVSFEFETYSLYEAACLRPTGWGSVYGALTEGGDPGAEEMWRSLERSRELTRLRGTYSSWSHILHEGRDLAGE